MKRNHLLAAPLLAYLLFPAHAASVAMPLDILFSDEITPPAYVGSEPWLLVTTSDTGANQVSMTFTAPHLTGDEFVKDWYFNVDPSLDLSQLVFTLSFNTGGFAAPTLVKTTNGHAADSGGLYDVHLSFSSTFSDRYTFGDALGYDVTYTGVGILDSSSFSFLGATNEQTLYGPYNSAAHIQSTGVGGAGSAWVGAVPEPSSILYSLLAATFSLGYRRRR